MTTVLLVDDHDLVRGGFRLILEAADPPIVVVGEADNGRSAVALTRTLKPDVVLMDVRMPELDGIAATREIVASGSTVRILVLTTYDSDQYVYRAFRAGASGFLLKNAPIDQLARAIHAVAAGETLLSPVLTRRLVEQYVASPSPEHHPGLRTLSDREREVLALVAEGLANAEIAGRLHIGVGTVKTHVTRLLTKLDLRDRVQAVVFAYENGIITPGRPRLPGPAHPRQPSPRPRP